MSHLHDAMIICATYAEQRGYVKMLSTLGGYRMHDSHKEWINMVYIEPQGNDKDDLAHVKALNDWLRREGFSLESYSEWGARRFVKSPKVLAKDDATKEM
ncbi:hypothetical protein J3F83DRAFT_753139 [Trichoderma novae-zelandiae]